jgi:hypothetical protein
VAPQFWSTINFNRPEKGACFFSPLKYLVLQRLIANSRYLRHFAGVLGGVLRGFAAFCGELATTASAPQKMFVTIHTATATATGMATATKTANMTAGGGGDGGGDRDGNGDGDGDNNNNQTTIN